MKKFKYLSIVSMAVMLSCGQAAEKSQQDSTKESSNTEQKKEDPSSAASAEVKEDFQKKFAGHYKNEVKSDPALTGMETLASIDVTLNEDGSFKGTEKVMGVSASVQGTWAYDEKTEEVALTWNGKPWHLKVGMEGKTLTDEKEGIQLQKQ